MLAGILVYSGTLGSAFHFDDEDYIVRNPVVRDLGLFTEPSGARVFDRVTEFDAFVMRYVAFLTFALNFRLHGLHVEGYHAVNILIHIVNALLVYALVLLTFALPGISVCNEKGKTSAAAMAAFLSSMIFVSHPVQTQAVTYISQRFASLAALFCLLSLLLYIRSRQSLSVQRYLLYAGSFTAAVFAMKTKEISFTLPVIIAVYELMFLKGRVREKAAFLLPLLLTMLIIPVSILMLNRPAGELIGDLGGATRALSDMPRHEYLFSQFGVVATYLRILCLPVGQNLDYDYPAMRSFFAPGVLLPLAMILGLIALGSYMIVRTRRIDADNRLKVISFGIFWFFICLSVESSIIPTNDLIFEHRLYLPSVGAFVAFTAALSVCSDKYLSGRPGIRRAAAVLLCLMVMTLGVTAYNRNLVWADDITLWGDVVRKSPGKARGYANLGKAYLDRGMINEAIQTLQHGLSIDPYQPKSYNNIAVAYKRAGNLGRAVEHLTYALNLSPDYADAHFNLGMAFLELGNNASAREHFSRAVQSSPGMEQARRFLEYTERTR